MQGAATFAVVAAQLQQAVEDDAGAHGVPNKGHRPVAMRALHQYMRQQPPRLRAAEISCFVRWAKRVSRKMVQADGCALHQHVRQQLPRLHVAESVPTCSIRIIQVPASKWLADVDWFRGGACGIESGPGSWGPTRSGRRLGPKCIEWGLPSWRAPRQRPRACPAATSQTAAPAGWPPPPPAPYTEVSSPPACPPVHIRPHPPGM